MIDLHTHILPGLDDGAADMRASLAMARRAAEDGVRTIVATPHVNFRYEFDYSEIGRLVRALNDFLERENCPVTILPGAEIDLARLTEIAPTDLSHLTLAGGRSLLVESPYGPAPGALDQILYDTQVRGYRPVLAHPERSPVFHSDVDRLQRLVDSGILCSITAGSLVGAFGSTVRRFTSRLLRDGLVHDIASDAHDADRRPPLLGAALQSASSELRGLTQQGSWYTRDAPKAILEGLALPPAPAGLAPPPRWRRR